MIEWGAFLTVLVVTLVSATVIVTLFSLGLRIGDGGAAWSRPVAVLLYVVCALAVAFGLVLIVPQLTDLVFPHGILPH